MKVLARHGSFSKDGTPPAELRQHEAGFPDIKAVRLALKIRSFLLVAKLFLILPIDS